MSALNDLLAYVDGCTVGQLRDLYVDVFSCEPEDIDDDELMARDLNDELDVLGASYLNKLHLAHVLKIQTPQPQHLVRSTTMAPSDNKEAFRKIIKAVTTKWHRTEEDPKRETPSAQAKEIANALSVFNNNTTGKAIKRALEAITGEEIPGAPGTAHTPYPQFLALVPIRPADNGHTYDKDQPVVMTGPRFGGSTGLKRAGAIGNGLTFKRTHVRSANSDEIDAFVDGISASVVSTYFGPEIQAATAVAEIL